MDAFYEELAPGRFRATDHTVGPWSLQMQHGGPPAALLTREMERSSPREGMMFARITVEILGPIPPTDLAVSARILRPGKRVELLGAELSVDGRPVARASGWRHAVADTAEVAIPGPPPMDPPERGHYRDRPDGWVGGYLEALEWRWLYGALERPGPGAAWARLQVAVVAGELPSAAQRVMAVVDSANGVAAPLDARAWVFLNTELTVHLHAEPTGEWVGIEATTTVGPGGLGLCAGVVHDLDGAIGRVAQALTVARRD